MGEGLSTGAGGNGRQSGLSGAMFSKADDCADLVFRFKWLFWNGYFEGSFVRVGVFLW
jgi:hypothetical protein